jgi:hypothetical protein
LQGAIGLLKDSKTAMQIRIAIIGKRRLHVDRMVLLLVAALLVGCGSGLPVAHLKGKVTIAGQPIPSDARARIIFAAPVVGATRMAKPAIVNIVNSQYDAPNVPVGQITANFDIQQDGREVGRGMREAKNLVPPDHQSGIAFTVAEGSQTKDFDL